MKIAVLYTELAAQHASAEELSIINDAQQVATVLQAAGYLTELIPFSLRDLSQTTNLLAAAKPDLVFNLVDEVDGIFEFSHLPAAYLEALRYKYTGCSSTSLAITTDKVLTKEILERSGIPTAPWLCSQNLALQKQFSGLRFLVKHRYLDGSAGLNEAEINLYGAGPELDRLLLADPNLMAEQYIDGREFAVPIFNHQGEVKVLGVVETQFLDYPKDKLKIFGSRAKWNKESFEYEKTVARLNFPPEDQLLLDHMQKITRQCWDVLHLKSYARVDFRVDLNNQPFVLEINGNPSIAAIDWLALAAEDAGITYQQMVLSIVEGALGNG